MSINEFDKYVKMPAITISEEWPSFYVQIVCVRADAGFLVCKKALQIILTNTRTHMLTQSFAKLEY